MIIITEPGATEEQIEEIVARVREFGFETQISRGSSRVIVGVIGPEESLSEQSLEDLPGVEAVVPRLKPYKLAAYEARGIPSTVEICGVSIGGDSAVTLICGTLLGRESRANDFRGTPGQRFRRTDFARRRI